MVWAGGSCVGTRDGWAWAEMIDSPLPPAGTSGWERRCEVMAQVSWPSLDPSVSLSQKPSHLPFELQPPDPCQWHRVSAVILAPRFDMLQLPPITKPGCCAGWCGALTIARVRSGSRSIGADALVTHLALSGAFAKSCFVGAEDVPVPVPDANLACEKAVVLSMVAGNSSSLLRTGSLLALRAPSTA